MARARKTLIDLDSTNYYHVISRCVRRAFLCGEDKYSGKNFDHRRQWVLDQLRLLSSVFSIDVAAYAIMSNHYHLVLRVNREEALSWSQDEVISRWYKLYAGHPLVDLYRQGRVDDKARLAKIAEITQTWRLRLFDISWFMRNLNETIARAANKEDNCTGRYWEGRYYSQALLDEQALLSCMMYVDLNPVRAGMCDDLITSDFTSIQERIITFKASQKASIKRLNTPNRLTTKKIKQPPTLLPFGSGQDNHAIAFTLYDYVELADWSGRAIAQNKRGAIDDKRPKLIDELGIDSEAWIDIVKNFRRHYGNFAGSEQSLRRCANEHHHCWYKGVG